jgi:hypothetical protein
VAETVVLSRFDAKSGSLTCKTRIDQAATAFTPSPWAGNGKVFLLSEAGRTFVVAAGETFQLLHVNELDDMALAWDRLVMRTEHRLYSIRRSTSICVSASLRRCGRVSSARTRCAPGLPHTSTGR